MCRRFELQRTANQYGVDGGPGAGLGGRYRGRTGAWRQRKCDQWRALAYQLANPGLRFRFSKLYANQSAENARFAMRYVHRDANQIGIWLSLLAVLMAWAGIVLMMRKQERLPPSIGPALVVSGALLAMLSFGMLSASVMPASILGLLVGVVLACLALWQRWRSSRQE